MEIYVHIPFCLKKCFYCDFTSFKIKNEEIYVNSLVEEIKNKMVANEITSVFIGGGTPTVLSPILLEKIFLELYKYNLSKNCEITIEANPETLSEDYIKFLSNYVNRMSIGLQSTKDSLLKNIGRVHSYKTFLKNYEIAKKYVNNINIDLMFSLPNQSLKDYKESLEEICSLEPSHISSYSLIIEENTPFYNMDINIDESLDREMYFLTEEILSRYKYNRYEISNYSKEGMECKHNIGYWTGIPYLGLGLGSSSYIDGTRYSNTKNINKYNEKKGINCAEDIIKLSKKEEMEEFCFLGLRLMKGIKVTEFTDKFNENIFEIYGSEINGLIKNNLLVKEENIIRLSKKGIDLSNYVFEKFIKE
ncbi:MAG: radical SAM family heme chaperone HemW [Lachnospirales bacterium]